MQGKLGLNLNSNYQNPLSHILVLSNQGISVLENTSGVLNPFYSDYLSFFICIGTSAFLIQILPTCVRINHRLDLYSKYAYTFLSHKIVLAANAGTQCYFIEFRTILKLITQNIILKSV